MCGEIKSNAEKDALQLKGICAQSIKSEAAAPQSAKNHLGAFLSRREKKAPTQCSV